MFARLVIGRPKDVVDFLATFEIGGTSGLQVVMTAWLENSNVFSGYSEIKTKYVKSFDNPKANTYRISTAFLH